MNKEEIGEPKKVAMNDEKKNKFTKKIQKNAQQAKKKITE